jgi:hypothetical protein
MKTSAPTSCGKRLRLLFVSPESDDGQNGMLQRRAGGHSKSTQAQTLERSVSRSSTDVGHNDQFKNGDPGEVKLILLDLAHCVRGTEIPLLAHNLSKRASAIRRPSQDELLGALCLVFFEDERDACESLRLIEG